jgi:hypothetical protein
MNTTTIPNNEEITKTELENFLRKVSYFFGKDIIEEIAKETEFVQKESKLTGHLFLSLFVFAVSIHGNPTLEQLIGLLCTYLEGFKISRPGLYKRINEKAVVFFEKILSWALAMAIPEILKLNIPQAVKRILILDSTKFQLPDELAIYFQGNGGSASSAGMKIQFCYDYKGSFWFYRLQSATESDHSIDNDLVEEVQPGDLSINDLGYFNVETFDGINQKGGYYLSRMKTDATFYIQNEEGEFIPFNLVRFVRSWLRSPLDRIELSGFIRSKHNVFTPVRLIIERLPNDVVNQRLRKKNKEAQSRGYQVSHRSRVLASVNLYITNAPKELLPSEYCRKLYSIRWQIELIFKAWKSHFSIDKVRGKSIERVKTTLFAKLIFITLTSKMIQAANTSLWFSSRREISYFRAMAHFKVCSPKFLESLLKDSRISFFFLLSGSINFIKEHSFKIPQEDHIYPLEMLENLHFLTLG